MCSARCSGWNQTLSLCLCPCHRGTLQGKTTPGTHQDRGGAQTRSRCEMEGAQHHMGGHKWMGKKTQGKSSARLACSVPCLRPSPGGDNTRGAFQAGEEEGERREACESHGSLSPEPSSLYPLADPENATASSKCLCQPLLPPGASPRVTPQGWAMRQGDPEQPRDQWGSRP